MKLRFGLLVLVVLAGTALATVVRQPAAQPGEILTATPAHGRFADRFREYLGPVLAAGEALVDLGERRERNLFIVGQRQSAMNFALDATDAWLAAQPTHEHDSAVAAYRSGAAQIREAMADAQAAFLRFDWEAIATANDTLRQGMREITAAWKLLPPPEA